MKWAFSQKFDGWKNAGRGAAIALAGAEHRFNDVIRFADGASAAAKAGRAYGVELVREPSNPFDNNAIAVFGYWEAKRLFGTSTKRTRVGYLPREVAAEYASKLDGGQLRARLLSVYRSSTDFLDVKIILVVPK